MSTSFRDSRVPDTPSDVGFLPANITTQWRLRQYVLSGAYMTDNFKLRFRAKAQMDGPDITNRETIAVDEVSVTEYRP